MRVYQSSIIRLNPYLLKGTLHLSKYSAVSLLLLDRGDIMKNKEISLYLAVK